MLTSTKRMRKFIKVIFYEACIVESIRIGSRQIAYFLILEIYQIKDFLK